MPVALYPGSFDPVTNGHLDVVAMPPGFADRLVLAIGTHPGKAPLFSPKNGSRCWRRPAGRSPSEAGTELQLHHLRGLGGLDRAPGGATLLIRGLRDGTDLDYEMQMAGMNEAMAPDVQTIFLPASPLVRPITATLVRQIAAMGGDMSHFVPPPVVARLKTKLPKR